VEDAVTNVTDAFLGRVHWILKENYSGCFDMGANNTFVVALMVAAWAYFAATWANLYTVTHLATPHVN
jgi:hypothetical protein